jgi:hypothetical protein
MKLNKYIRQLILTYSRSKKKYSIIEILKDLKQKGKRSLYRLWLGQEAAARVRQMGLLPYDKKNTGAIYKAILDILYEETDLVDVLEALNLNKGNIDKTVIEEAEKIIKSNSGLIREILKGRVDNEIINNILAEDKTYEHELAQWRRAYSSQASKFIKELALGLALIFMNVSLQAKGAVPQTDPVTIAAPKNRAELVVNNVPENTTKHIIIREFKTKVDSIKLQEGFKVFYNSLKLTGLPEGEQLLTKLYKRAVFYTNHMNKFDYKFGNSKSIYNTLLRSDSNDVYVKTVRDLFIASVAGGALERAWEITDHYGFTNDEVNEIILALSTHSYSVEFINVVGNKPTNRFSNVINIKITLKNQQLAVLTVKIESLGTFDFYDPKNRNIARELRNNFVTAILEDGITNTYGFYMLLPNGIDETSHSVHYLGIVFKVSVQAYKVSQEAADSSSSSIGMAKLKNKDSRMFRKRKKYSWM